MAGDASGECEPFKLGTEAYVPVEVAPSELSDAADFGLIVRSLLSDVRRLRDAVLPLRDWAAFLALVVETYVAAASDAEVEPLASCLRHVESVRDFDVGTRAVPYRIAYELVRARLMSASIGRGSEGVIVSGLRSSRPVPARIVFACGMGEGRFPATDSEDPLDLRRAKRLPEDVSARERDKYGFLEWMLAARDRLYVSYVSRESLTGNPLAAASVVEDLLDMLGRGYVRDPSRLVRRHPLRRWDESYFPEVFATPPSSLGTIRIDEAQAEARTVALRRSADAVGARVTPETVRARAALEPAWQSLADNLGFANPWDGLRTRADELTLPLSVLVSFLELPLQGWGRICIGLEEDERVDPEATEEEPLATDPREVISWLRRVWLASRGSAQPVEAAYDSAVQARALRGHGPAGLFAEGERLAQLGMLLAWTREIEKLGPGADSATKVHRFGAGVDVAACDVAHRPLRLAVDLSKTDGTRHTLHVDLDRANAPENLGSLPHAFATLVLGQMGGRPGRTPRIRRPGRSRRFRSRRTDAVCITPRRGIGGDIEDVPSRLRSHVSRGGHGVDRKHRGEASLGAARCLPPLRGRLCAPRHRPRRRPYAPSRVRARHSRLQGPFIPSFRLRARPEPRALSPSS